VISRPAVVVGLWIGANLLLMAMLIGFGENAFAIALYAASALPISLFALAVWRGSGRNQAAGDHFRLSGGSDAVPWLALGIGVAALALIFGEWLVGFGAVLFGVGIARSIRAARSRPAGHRR
jgi:type IV secretory pathway TrbD component